MGQILTIIASILAIIIGLWRKFGRVAAEKRKQAEQARKDLDDANKNDDSSSFLDGFGRL
jgi:Na+/H+ antiporter NhaB